MKDGSADPAQERLLIVEDNPYESLMHERILRQTGRQIDQTARGDEALAKVRAANYDLILLDLCLPGMSGLEVLEQLRPGATKVGPRVIVITGQTNETDIAIAMRKGAHDCLTKPVEARELRARIDHALLNRHLEISVRESEERMRKLYQDAERSRRALLSMLEDQKRGETALRESEARYRYFVEQTNEGFYRLAFDPPIPVTPETDEMIRLMYERGSVAECNDIFACMYGHERARDMIGARLVDLHGGADNPENLAAMRNFVEQAFRHLDVETVECDKHGRKLWFNNNSVGVVEDGHYVACWGTQQDITARKQHERSLAVYARLGGALSAAGTAAEAARIIVDAADELIGWDACTLDLYSEHDSHVRFVLSLDLIDGERKECPAAYDNRLPSTVIRRTITEGPQLVLRKKDDTFAPDVVLFGDTSRRSASLMFVPIRYQGEAIGVLSAQSYTFDAYGAEDLHTLQSLADHCAGALHRIDTDRARRESDEMLRLVTDAMPVHISYIDRDMRYQFVNAAYEKTYGRPPSEIVGRPLEELMLPEVFSRARPLVEAALAGEELEQEFPLPRRQGPEIAGLIHLVPRREADGSVVGAYAFLADISAVKRAEQEVRRRDQILTALSESTALLLSGGDWREKIAGVLGSVARATRVQRASLFRFHAPVAGNGKGSDSDIIDSGRSNGKGAEVQRFASKVAEWAADGTSRSLGSPEATNLDLVANGLDRWLVSLSRNEPVHGLVKNFPADEQAALEAFGAQSLAAVPVTIEYRTWGYFLLDDCQSERHWSEAELGALGQVADTLSAAIQRRRSDIQLRRTRKSLEEAQQRARIGSWEFDPNAGAGWWSAEMYRLFDRDPKLGPPSRDEMLQLAHPEDRECFQQNFVASNQPGQRADFEFRGASTVGEHRWFAVLAECIERDGRRLKVGTTQEITERRAAELELANQQRIIEEILETSMAGWWDWRIPEHTEYLSPGFKRMFGYAEDELENKPETWQRLIFPDDLARVMESYERHVASHGREPFANEVRYRHRDGSVVWVYCSGSVIEWDGDQPLRMVGSHVDITSSKRVEEQFRYLAENTSAVPWVVDVAENRFTFVGPQSEAIFGIPPDAWYAPGFWEEHIDDEDRDWAPAYCSEQAGEGDNFQFEYRMTAKDGQVRWVHDVVHVTRGDDGAPRQMSGFLIDITERRAAEERLAELRQRLVEVREEERTQIARDLHDELGQLLARIQMDLGLSEQFLHAGEAGRNQLEDKLVDAGETALRMQEEIRRIVQQLRPTVLDELGLVAAIQQECARLNSENITAEFSTEQAEYDFPDPLNTALFRLAQEMITNVIRHSHARKCRVSLSADSDSCHLWVSDDGVGTDPAQLLRDDAFGVLGMRERVAQLDGEFTLLKAAGGGTEVRVRLPLQPSPLES